MNQTINQLHRIVIRYLLLLFFLCVRQKDRHLNLSCVKSSFAVYTYTYGAARCGSWRRLVGFEMGKKSSVKKLYYMESSRKGRRNFVFWGDKLVCTYERIKCTVCPQAKSIYGSDPLSFFLQITMNKAQIKTNTIDFYQSFSNALDSLNPKIIQAQAAI